MSKAFMGITIDPHVSIGHIFTTVAAIVAGVSAYASMQNRIHNLEQADIRLHYEDTRILALMETHRKERQVAFDRIDLKLDKIYDKLDSKADKE